MDAPATFPPPTYRQRRPRSFIFPMLLVVVGIVLLLNNLGVLAWSVWTAIGQLWPALLILLGIDLLIGRRSSWVGAAVPGLAFIGILGFAIWITVHAPASAAPFLVAETQDTSVPLSAATSGQVTIQFGAGMLNVGALPAGSTDLVQATATLPDNMRLTEQSTVRGNTVDATINTTGSGNGWPFRAFGGPNNLTMKAQLAQRIPLDVRAEVGAGQADFNLSDLQVTQFTLNNGAGQATVQFPTRAGQTIADIHSGAGQITLDVPAGVGAYIHGGNGLVSFHVSDRYQKVPDGYQTSDFASAANRVDVTLHVGIGEVDVQ